MAIDRAYLEATMQNLDAQEREATQMVERVRGARLLCEAILEKLSQDEAEAKAEAEKETNDAEGGE